MPISGNFSFSSAQSRTQSLLLGQSLSVAVCF